MEKNEINNSIFFHRSSHLKLLYTRVFVYLENVNSFLANEMDSVKCKLYFETIFYSFFFTFFFKLTDNPASK